MKKNKLIILLAIVFLTLFVFVSAFQGTSPSYSSDNKFDSFSDGNTSSTSFSQRVIGGIQSVGQYVSNNLAGRFGILSIDKNLIINITSHLNFDKIIRGNDAVAGEDDKGYVPNVVNFTANVYDNLTLNGFSGATCYFYDDGVLFGTAVTNSSGQCTSNLTKSSLSVSSRNISVNYSIPTSDSIVIARSEVNVSLIRYVTILTMGNLRTSGCATGVSSCYYHGDNATLRINLTKINETGTSMYDPLNISVNATNAAETVYTNGDFFYPGNSLRNITRSELGLYNVNVTVNQSFGSQVRWDVLISDNNFSDFISTAVHADAVICAGDFGAFGDWSACASGTQTRSKTDSTSCTQVEVQSCTDGDGDTSCFPAGTKILMADGTSKNIEDVRIGEEVKSYDLVAGEVTSAKVLELESPIREGFYSINNKINVTDEHPFYVLKQNGDLGWAAITKEKTEIDIGKSKLNELTIYDLEIGDKFFTSEGDWVSVDSIEYYHGEIQTYNLKSINEYNVFFANDFLVHNKGESCVPSWGAWSDWGVCDGTQETRTRGDGCGNTENEIRTCGCIPDWECTGWNSCEVGTSLSPPIQEISLDANFKPEIEPAVVSGPMSGFLFEELLNKKLLPNILEEQKTLNVCEVGDIQCHPSKQNVYQECIQRKKFRLFGTLINLWKDKNVPKGMICSGSGTFVCSQNNACDIEGIALCTTTNQYKICEKDSNDCLKWGSNLKCSRGDVCSEGDCVSGKTKDSNVCEIGQRTCINNVPNLCQLNKKGINLWEKQSSCSNSETCVEGQCVLNYCFNGIKDGNEEGIDCGGSCDVKCVQLPEIVCGNSVIDEGEFCDDGNTLEGDGCSSVCKIEEPIILSPPINQTGNNTTVGNNSNVEVSLNPGQVLMGVGEIREVEINKGDKLQVVYDKQQGDKVILTINKISTNLSTTELEMHTIKVDEILLDNVKVTISSTPITKEIPLGDNEIFDFSSELFLSPENSGTTIVSREGMQNRTCTDLNACGVDSGKPTEEQMCIVGLQIEYSPQNLFLALANNTPVDFSVTISDTQDSLIEVKWYIDGVFNKGISGVGSLSSSFDYMFSKNSQIKVEVNVGGSTEIRVWEVNIADDLKEDCNENWYCSWSKCDGSFKYAEECEDLNSCGTNLNKPLKKECSCVPDYQCESWGECDVNYDIGELIYGKVSLTGIENRVCEEITNCIDEEDSIIEKRECNATLSIRVEQKEWCFENYIEIYDVETNNLVSRIKERSINNVKKVEIGFIATEYEGMCGYCFDSVKNFDETGVDCGGICGECIKEGSYSDYVYPIKISLWILLLLFIIYSVYKYRDELINLPKERIRSIRLYRINMFRFNIHRISLPKFRMPHLRIEFGRRIRKLRPAKPKVSEPRIYIPRTPKPYSRLGNKLRDWRKRGYYGTVSLEHSLARVITNVQKSARLARTRRELYNNRIRRERELARERKNSQRELRKRESERVKVEKRRIQRSFFSSLLNRIKIRRSKNKSLREFNRARAKRIKEERKKEKELKKREKIKLKEERHTNYEKKRNEQLKLKEEKLKEKLSRKRSHRSFFTLFIENRAHKKAKRKIIKHEKRKAKKEMKEYHRKIKKKQISKREAEDLRRKLREWKEKGYYGTTPLQKKLDRYEGRNPEG